MLPLISHAKLTFLFKSAKRSKPDVTPGLVPNWRSKAGIKTQATTNEDTNTGTEPQVIGGLDDDDAAADRPLFESTGGPGAFAVKIRENQVSNAISFLT